LHHVVNVLTADISQREDVRKTASLDSLDLGFPDDEEDSQNDGLSFRIFNVFIY